MSQTHGKLAKPSSYGSGSELVAKPFSDSMTNVGSVDD